ncbi:MAG: hypothetical protein AAF220_08755 [Pseudomonadota bacterium]
MSDEETGALRVPGVAVVFLSRDVLLHHYKTLGEVVNNDQRIGNAAADGRTVIITPRKSGFTRQLLLGNLQAATFEYGPQDWKVATQGFTHLPDLVFQSKANLIVIGAFDIQYAIAVLRAVYAEYKQPLSNEEMEAAGVCAKDLTLGDVVLYNRARSKDLDEGMMWDPVYSLGDDVPALQTGEEEA